MGYCLSPGLDKWFSSLTSASQLELAFVSLLLHDSEHHTPGLGRRAQVQGGRIKCCSFGLVASPSRARRLCERGFLLAPSHGMGMRGRTSWLAFGFSLSGGRDHRRSTSLASTVLVNTVATGALKSQGQECTGASAMAPLTKELEDCFNRQVARP